MDFFTVEAQTTNSGNYIMPLFGCRHMKDFMIRGRAFYAIWDEETGLWSRSESMVYDLVDDEIARKKKEVEGTGVVVKRTYWMNRYQMKDSNASSSYASWIKGMYDVYHSLDDKVTYLSQQTTRKDYASKRLPYDLDKTNVPLAYNELMDTLYSKEERRKLEWAVGAILNGDGKDIQKMLVLYGPPGSGKSTFLHIVEQLLEGYWTVFDAKSLTSGKSDFATHFFKDNPLVAIQHDGLLNKIEDNSLLNSIISHEDIVVNEKFKAQYVARANCMLLLGTNSPVKISDAKSGLIRRVIDVSPSGNKVENTRYFELMDRIPFELGAIAWQCIKVYRHFGKRYYDSYRPIGMMYATDVFFNFIVDHQLILEKDDPMDLDRVWTMYKQYCEETNASFISQRYKFREELKNYYEVYDSKEKQFIGFKKDILEESQTDPDTHEEDEASVRWLSLDVRESLLTKVLAECPAQYASKDEVPSYKWENVKTTLKDLDTTKLHYVKPPLNHIVIDFDLKNDKGEKDAIKNIQAANKWPPTYAEYSKGGNGIHLHYIYDGDVEKLSRIFDEGVEVKVFTGNASLRRKLSFCNTLEVAHLSSGLPFKEDRKKVINEATFENEQHLRNVILKCLRREVHANTAPNIDYIKKLLDDAYASGMAYDVRDLRGKIITFAMKSTNQASECMTKVSQMKFCSEDYLFEPGQGKYKDDRLVFFDCEVFPNLFIICWKYDGTDDCVRMINPTAKEVGELFKFKLVGFNNLRYDNHILYARYLGYTEEELFKLSGKIINDKRSDAMFRNANDISYTDVWDFSSAGNRKSLKKWEIELGLPHQECRFPWDQPVPKEYWDEVADYCCNDVKATEAVFYHLEGDWKARQMLAALTDMPVNSTTNQLTTKFIFGNERHPKLVYTDLATGQRDDGTQDPIFWPDYHYTDGKNIFCGEDVGRGGYVYSDPGIYERVVCYDCVSMHPSSLIALNYFGAYTGRFKEIVQARVLIKHKDFEAAKKILDGKLAPYLDNPADAKSVSNALKTAINSVYGLTSASFSNPMRHPLNVNNIVALRGALFICGLKNKLLEMGVKVISTRTDSIKVVNPSFGVDNFIHDYAKRYGYEFEVEDTFDRICLINDAVFIAKLDSDDPNHPGEWTAKAAQFAEPYVFKTLFSHEDLIFEDLMQVKSVSGNATMYLDMNEGLSDDHNRIFIGRVSAFIPIKPGRGGGELVVKRDDKYNAVAGTKGYRWLEAEQVKLMSLENDIDMEYYHILAEKAIDAINKYGDFEQFVGDHEYIPNNN